MVWAARLTRAGGQANAEGRRVCVVCALDATRHLHTEKKKEALPAVCGGDGGGAEVCA
jgi:hypothetical protein